MVWNVWAVGRSCRRPIFFDGGRQGEGWLSIDWWTGERSGTYRGAKDLDLTPVILRGAIASGSPDNLAFVEKISDLVAYRFLIKILQASP